MQSTLAHSTHRTRTQQETRFTCRSPRGSETGPRRSRFRLPRQRSGRVLSTPHLTPPPPTPPPHVASCHTIPHRIASHHIPTQSQRKPNASRQFAPSCPIPSHPINRVPSYPITTLENHRHFFPAHKRRHTALKYRVRDVHPQIRQSPQAFDLL